MHRKNVASGWTETNLLLPQNVSQLTKFRGYIQQTGHDGGPQIALSCTHR